MENQLIDEMATVINVIWNEEAEISDLQKEMDERESNKSELRKELEALALAYYSQGQTGSVADKDLKLYDKVKLIIAVEDEQKYNVGKIATIVDINMASDYPYMIVFEDSNQMDEWVYSRGQLKKLEVR